MLRFSSRDGLHEFSIPLRGERFVDPTLKSPRTSGLILAPIVRPSTIPSRRDSAPDGVTCRLSVTEDSRLFQCTRAR